jgi:hypothetical protein
MPMNAPIYGLRHRMSVLNAPSFVCLCLQTLDHPLLLSTVLQWALSPDTGKVHWSLSVGPGGTVGGMQWGSAADQSRVYVANNNFLQVSGGRLALLD